MDEAGVCRNSFYRNYRSMDDIFQKRFLKICKDSDTLFRDGTPYDYYDVFASVCTQYQKNKRFFKCFYKADPKSYFDTIIHQIILSNTLPDTTVLAPEDYYIYACKAWTGMDIATEWLSRDCGISVEELTDILRRFALK